MMNNDKNNFLESEKFNLFIDNKEKNSVFTVTTVCTNCFKNLFKILKDVFITVTLKINSHGISIYKWEWSKTSKVKKNEISSLFYLTGIVSGDNPLILSNKCEKYDCNVDTIFIKILTSDLEMINKHITDDSVLYFFINKENYNSETSEASSIQFYVYDYNVSISDIVINCKK
jgi:hypothetical protein